MRILTLHSLYTTFASIKSANVGMANNAGDSVTIRGTVGWVEPLPPPTHKPKDVPDGARLNTNFLPSWGQMEGMGVLVLGFGLGSKLEAVKHSSGPIPSHAGTQNTFTH